MIIDKLTNCLCVPRFICYMHRINIPKNIRKVSKKNILTCRITYLLHCFVTTGQIIVIQSYFTNYFLNYWLSYCRHPGTYICQTRAGANVCFQIWLCQPIGILMDLQSQAEERGKTLLKFCEKEYTLRW